MAFQPRTSASATHQILSNTVISLSVRPNGSYLFNYPNLAPKPAEAMFPLIKFSVECTVGFPDRGTSLLQTRWKLIIEGLCSDMGVGSEEPGEHRGHSLVWHSCCLR